MTIGRQLYGVDLLDTTDSAGQQVRYFMPPGTAAAPLIIHCHPYTQNEQISVGYLAYPWTHAAVQEGWMYAASRLHGDSWGNDASLTDVVNLYTLMNGIRPVSAVIMVGASMGGLNAALTVAQSKLAAGLVKGVALADAVLDLNWAYTGNSGGYTTAINTAYGITSQAQIPAANNPMSYAATAYGSMRFRFYASSIDTSAAQASNTDPFRTLVAATAAESGLVSHNTTGHLNAGAFPPADFVAFVKRCLP